MFDAVALAPWPGGALFAKKLSGRGKKLCHVELAGAGRGGSLSFSDRSGSPFPCLTAARQAEEKSFLESIGFLFRQEGGFWLLSREGNWPLQSLSHEMPLRPGAAPPALSRLFQKAKGGESPPPPSGSGSLSFSGLQDLDFQSEWISLLAAGLGARIFEDNVFRLSGSRPSSAGSRHENSFSEPLDFLSDCFLFEPSLKKKRFFQEKHSDISWRRAPLSGINYQDGRLFISGEELPAGEIFWFGGELEARKVFPSLKGPDPEWEWISFEFKGDLGGYEDIVPKHFVSVGHEGLPWTHDNLLSVFRRGGIWEVWLRRPFSSSSSSRSGGSGALAAAAAAHLSRRFPNLRLILQTEADKDSNSAGGLSAPAAGCPGQSQKTGFLIYGPEALSRPARGAPPQVFLEDLRESPKGDIMSRLGWELRLSSERSARDRKAARQKA